ncbi:FAD-dependent oxidoreductase [Nonomuraea sp. NPDC050536]|uniref:FAD-dependent oxidoreductase n=1 Tax=Nonomuraea sp. NPDC050536 TaxID=3364366 RepID=UPI0037C7C15A
MEVTVIGAGLVGCLLTCFLARRGHEVTLYERRPDPRTGQEDSGRSINLAISERGLDALRRVGLADRVLAEALPMRGRMMHAVDGTLTFQHYSADGQQAINSIGRGALNRLLLEAARELPGVTVRFDHRLTGISGGELEFNGSIREKAQVVLGADGAYSAVRERLRGLPGVNYSQDYLDYGYKELTIPPGSGLDPGALHIWPRGSSMMIALPNPDGSFTCTLFWPYADFDLPDPLAYFARHYPDAVMPDLAAEFAANPVGHLVTVRCSPWHLVGDEVTIGLVGDAAHAIVPFYGQGANCGFEDCVELDRCLDEAGDDFPAALALYEQRRKPNADTIADLALDNFVEMRDRVASRAFLAGKRLEHALERLLPGRYVSRYELVSFSTVPYSDIKRRITRQRLALAAAAGGLGLAGYLGLLLARRRT